MEMLNSYDVTVLMINYRPQKDKVFNTLRSILLQENVKMQIVVADDGSDNNMFKEIEELFQQYQFNDYVLVANETNQGTTLNFYSGLVMAKGKYLKGISPGDYLYSGTTLSKWVEFMETGHYDCSFGDAVFYKNENEAVLPLERKYGNPVIPSMYDVNKYDEKWIYLSCFVLEDNILGASYFCKTELIKKYIQPLLGKVKYLEDALYRMMLLDHIQSVHYAESVIVYEYGTGVSTTSNNVWKQRVLADKTEINKILLSEFGTNPFCRKFSRFVATSHAIGKPNTILRMMAVFPKAFCLKIYRGILLRSGRLCTPTQIDKKFIERIGAHYASN